MRIATLLLLTSALLSAQAGFTRLSSRWGDLPGPFHVRQQTAALAADLDNDGAADIILTERTGSPSVVWLRRMATGWQRYAIDNTQLRIEAGGVAYDIDGDGDLDLIFGGDAGSNEVWWWENPYPEFSPHVAWKRRIIKNGGGRKHHDQAIADFTGDGRAELVFWNQGARKLFLAPIPANPKQEEPWATHEVYSWPSGEMEGIAAFDVNGDGKVDIVGGGRWFEHVSGYTFREHVIDASVPFSRAAAGQLIPGGWAEVVFVIGDGIGRLRWYQHRDDKWIPRDLLNHDVVHGHTLQIADVDGDGHLDIYCGEMGKWIHGTPGPNNPHPTSWIFYGDGKGNFTKTVVARGVGVHEGRLADLDGDGDLDILNKPYNHDTPRIDVLINNGNPRAAAAKLPLDQWRRHLIDEVKPWRSVFIDAADLDGDGRRDIVTGGWWYRNPGSPGGLWERVMFGSPFHNFAAFGDTDNDGLLDILATQGKGSEANSRMVFARNRGGGVFTLTDRLPAAEGDFLQGVVAIQAMPGPVSFALSWHKAGQGIQLLTPPRNPNEDWTWRRIHAESQDEDLTAGDIDRDGRQDLLLGTWWLRNEGDGKFTKFVLNSTPGDPDRNCLGDINNDGRLDAIVGFEAINKPGKLAWYEQPEDPTGTWTEHVIGEVVGPMSLDVADMDGDGDLDVIVGEHNYAEPAKAALWIFENADGAGKAWKRHAVFTGDEHHDGARVVDVDGDGDLDIISIGWSHPRVVLYENRAR